MNARIYFDNKLIHTVVGYRDESAAELHNRVAHCLDIYVGIPDTTDTSTVEEIKEWIKANKIVHKIVGQLNKDKNND